MAYYLDDCSGLIRPYGNDELPEAVAAAEHAIQSARDFESKMGFRPFWADAVEIRRGRADAHDDWQPGEAANAAIVANTKTYRRFKA